MRRQINGVLWPACQRMVKALAARECQLGPPGLRVGISAVEGDLFRR